MEQMSIIIDTREQLPYDFTGYCTINQALAVGDYSLVGFENNGIVVERKSFPDFATSITKNRDIFVRRLEKMALFERAWVILETTLERIERGNYLFSKVHPNSVIGAIAKIEAQYGISVMLTDTHRLGQVICLSLLRQYYEKKRKGVLSEPVS